MRSQGRFLKSLRSAFHPRGNKDTVKSFGDGSLGKKPDSGHLGKSFGVQDDNLKQKKGIPMTSPYSKIVSDAKTHIFTLNLGFFYSVCTFSPSSSSQKDLKIIL